MRYEYVSWDKFDPTPIDFYNNTRSKRVSFIGKDYMSLDTETSADDEDDEKKKIAWIYQWCLSYPKDEDTRYLVYGRKPTQLVSTLVKVHKVNELSSDKRIFCFIHNLSYDYTYFHKFLEDAFQQTGNTIAVAAHRLINYNMSGIEFRDTLKIAQKSLDAWAKDLLGRECGKLVGAIDYNKVRYQDTPLVKRDWDYMFRDVVVLDKCVEKQLAIHGDKIWTMPLTSTGYVRRATKKNFYKHKTTNRQYFMRTALSDECYSMCKEEFAGGITHGNRFYIDQTVRVRDLRKKFNNPNIIIKHRDFVSHYPSQQITGYCPSTAFRLYYDRKPDDPEFRLKDLDDAFAEGYCYLAAISITNLMIKDGVTLPYAQESKFRKYAQTKLVTDTDNGRILRMFGTTLIIVNELDLKWLRKQYNFTYTIHKVYVSKRGKFPDYITDTVKMFMLEKSETKEIVKDLLKKGYDELSPEVHEAKLQNLIAKGMLNAIYGMTATDPVRECFGEDEDGNWGKATLTDNDVSDRLVAFYSSQNSFMSFQLGCWTTALARNELLFFAEVIGYENFLYADTDSIFYISTPEIEKKIERYNKKFRKQDDENGWFVTLSSGKKVYFNQFDDEKEEIIEFRFLHSKCYAYVTSDGKLHTTIAGVREYGRNANNRVRELGDIDSLTAGTIFKDCGGTIIRYNPKGVSVKPRVENINGHLTEVSQFAIIVSSEKELHACIENREVTTFWETTYDAD